VSPREQIADRAPAARPWWQFAAVAAFLIGVQLQRQRDE